MGIKWKSLSEIEEERKRIEEERKRVEVEEKEEEKRIEEERQREIERIKASTEPSMDELGVLEFGGEDDKEGICRVEVTRREKMLFELGAFDLVSVIKSSTDPKMDELVFVEFGGEDDVRPPNIMQVTKREKMLFELGAFDVYEEYARRKKEQINEQIRKIREASTKEEEEKATIAGWGGRNEYVFTTSDGHEVLVRLTRKEKALHYYDALTQEEIDEICYREAPMSFWKIKKAITKFRERVGNKGKEDKGER